jgi:dihydroorotase
VFSNANVPVMDAGTQMRALQYIRHFDGLMYSLPIDMDIARGGMVNEGVQSTKLGLKGIPDMAEELMVVRDIALVEYTGSRLHFAKISTAGSVKLIREAKKRGLAISCGVASHHLLLTDEVLTAFDTHTKVFPPLRDKADQLALIEGIKDGTIDVICSDHQPEDVETKFKEFDLASFGAIGLETAFSAALTGVGKKLKIEQLLLAFNQQPATLLGLQQSVIAEGQPADLVAFDPSLSWEPSAADLVSKSTNSPFLGKKLSGKILLTLCNNQLFWNK